MSVKKVAIIGCGFAGLAAAARLSSRKKDLSVTVLDKNPYFNFLPMLPDVIGRGVKPEHLTYPIENLSRKSGFDFIPQEARSIDLEASGVLTAQGKYGYDYLIIACGSETNFYGNDRIRTSAFKLDDASDARRIRENVESGDFNAYLISGAGYTGIEIAANLRICLEKMKRDRPIIIVEKAPGILGPLPEWMKAFVGANLRDLKIEVRLNTSVGETGKNRVTLSDGAVFDNAMLIWAAGVKTPDCVRNLNVEKTPQGRLKVDRYLRIKDNCFSAGDTASFAQGSGSLRMAVQFAIAQGETSALNVIRSLEGKSLREYKPRDFGYIIPMANNRSCGLVLGLSITGFAPTLLHYVMCIFRSRGLARRLKMLWQLRRIF